MANVEIDEDLVRSLLREQYPDLAGLRLRQVTAGWDNQLWRLGEDLAVRLPRTPRAPSLLRKEHQWLPVLAPRLPLAVPTPVRMAEPSARFPQPWIVATWVPGEPGDRASISRGQHAADSLAGFLRALHQAAPTEAPTNPGRCVPLQTLTHEFDRTVQAVASSHATEARAVWDDAVSAPRWEGPPVWLHADLHPANVVVSNGTIAGVIDFGELCAGDPATDLAVAWLLLPTDASSRFFDAYARADDATVRRARGWAVLRSLSLVGIGQAWDKGLPGGQPTWGLAGRTALERVLASSRPPTDEFRRRPRSYARPHNVDDARSHTMSEQRTTDTTGTGAYAEVNGINLYYETHGTGRPMILLHGGLGSGEMFGPILPTLAESHQVITVDLQGHGRTADIDRPIDIRLMADDIAALIGHIGLDRPDVVGYSLGGGVAFHTAVKYPEKVSRLVITSAHVRRDAIPAEMLAQQGQVSSAAVEFMKDTPMYQLYQQVAPRPEDFGRLLDKIGESMAKDFDYSEEVRGLQVPTLVVAGDADMAPPSHFVEVFKLLDGGLRDGGWMGEGRPKGGHALAILPGLTHYNIFASPLLAAVVLAFLDEQQTA